jgi:hypothetical protein
MMHRRRNAQSYDRSGQAAQRSQHEQQRAACDQHRAWRRVLPAIAGIAAQHDRQDTDDDLNRSGFAGGCLV